MALGLQSPPLNTFESDKPASLFFIVGQVLVPLPQAFLWKGLASLLKNSSPDQTDQSLVTYDRHYMVFFNIGLHWLMLEQHIILANQNYFIDRYQNPIQYARIEYLY